MDNVQYPFFVTNPLTAIVNLIVTLLTGIFASIASNIELWIRGGAGLVAILSGTAAFLYYRESWIEKRTARLKQKTTNIP